jgi:DNA-binding winged helix-turn-helix (wHTH) protein
MGNKSFVFRFADVEVREREFTLIKAGKALTVEPKAFRALLFLLHNPQRLISKEELLNSLWGDAAVTEGSLTRCIWLLRRLLEDDIHQPRYIETVATVGYRFVCPVEVLEEGGYGIESKHVSAETADGAIQAKPRSLRRWWLVAAAILVVGLACLIWYLRRPLPPPRISRYAQITHDGRWKWPVGTDGSRLYFAQGTPVSIAQVGIAGGEIVQIPVPVPYLMGLAAWVKASTQPFPPMENPSFTPRRAEISMSFGAMAPKLTNWPRSDLIPTALSGRQMGASSGFTRMTSFGRCRRGDRIFISCFPVGTLWANAAAVGPPMKNSSCSCPNIRA